MLRSQEIKDVKCGLPVRKKEKMVSGRDTFGHINQLI